MSEMKHYLSFGGGVNSVALYLLMKKLNMDFEAVFNILTKRYYKNIIS